MIAADFLGIAAREFFTKELAWRESCGIIRTVNAIAGWSSPVARQAHNLKVAGSNPAPATN